MHGEISFDGAKGILCYHQGKLAEYHDREKVLKLLITCPFSERSHPKFNLSSLFFFKQLFLTHPCTKAIIKISHSIHCIRKYVITLFRRFIYACFKAGPKEMNKKEWDDVTIIHLMYIKKMNKKEGDGGCTSNAGCPHVSV